ncbi:WD40 repeat domain-containing protein [Streptomyces sp. NPDC001985]|uniref:WD40 repeat domain-containing protein n=1 Tax=Streptomyces sp. NPDC001985 TaxID=3154406 RepID=UPI00331C0B88
MIEHKGPISGVAAHGDAYVATAGYDNQVILWDQSTGKALGRVVHDHLANQCAFTPDGRRLVTSSSDYTARLWSVPDLRLLAVFNDQSDDVEMSVPHPTRELVAAVSRDHHARVYDYSGALVQRLSGHTADVISAAWVSEDELITSSDDGTVKRWQVGSGALLEDIDLGGVETDTVAVGADGTLYAGNDAGQIVVIRSGVSERVDAHRSGVKRLVLDAGRALLVSLSYDRSLRIWDVSGPLPVQVDEAAVPDDVWPRSCAFAGASALVFGTFGATYRTYDYRRRAWRAAVVRPTHGVNAACALGARVLSVGDAGIVRRDGKEHLSLGSLCNFLTPAPGLVLTGGQLGLVMDALSGRALHQHRSPLNCGAVFERGGVPHAVIGSYTGDGLVFALGGGGAEHVGDLPLHENAVKGVAVSGELIFSVCADRSVAWHSTRTLAEVHRVEGAHGRIANGCVALGGGAFASTGRDLVLRLWDADFGCESVPTPHTHSVKCVCAGADGRFIATGAYDGHVAVFDRERGRWQPALRPTTSGISSLAYHAGRRCFLAGSYDGSVYEIPEGAV